MFLDRFVEWKAAETATITLFNKKLSHLDALSATTLFSAIEQAPFIGLATEWPRPAFSVQDQPWTR
jgi:hypothetical protein